LPTPTSTNKGLFVAHPVQDSEPLPPPKPKIDLSMPNVDPKEEFQSSYSQSHTGELPSPDDEVARVPRTTFQSSLAFEDGEKTRPPLQSTNKGQYVAHPVQDNEPVPPPKGQLDLTQPNVDPKELFQSSYKSALKGEPLREEDEITYVPRTAFQSSLVLEDLEGFSETPQSTQRNLFVAHPVQDVEPAAPPKSQLDLSQPNVDPKEEYQSSYKNSHKGEPLAEEDETITAPRTAFKSSLALVDGDKSGTPKKSSQKEQFVAHPVQDYEPHPPPKGQLDLTQPNVDYKEHLRSSYKQSHKGETLSQEDEPAFVPRTSFKSSLVLEDAEKSPIPKHSTNKGSYVAHPVQDSEPHPPPKAQISLSQPNVDTKEMFQSSYKQSHKGEALPAEDEPITPPRTAFKSSFALEDGDMSPTPRRSIHKEQFVAHPVQNVEPTPPPKPQISLSQPNVDPKETFRSSYSKLHTGEQLSPDDEPISPPPRTAFQSNFSLQEGYKTPTSTSKGNYAAHPVTKIEPATPPKSNISLSQPNVNVNESFQSSSRTTYRGESHAPGDEVTPVARTAFQSNISLDEGRKQAPLVSTAKLAYATPTSNDSNEYRIEPGRNVRSSISLGNDTTPRASTSTSSYARPPQEAIVNGSPLRPTKSAWDSSVSLYDNSERPKTPVVTSREVLFILLSNSFH
jgi:hypothetical protein